MTHLHLCFVSPFILSICLFFFPAPPALSPQLLHLLDIPFSALQFPSNLFFVFLKFPVPPPLLNAFPVPPNPPLQLLDLMDDPSTALLESLLAALADDSDQVVLEALSVQATVASHPHHFHRLLLLLLLRFNSDRALLDRRGSIIIRHLCAMLDADKVLRELAFILQNESDCQFAATIVPTLSLILLTAPELAPIRSKLRRSFAAPAPAYEHAWCIVDALEESDLSLSLMVQMDKLVLLLETPIFSRLRLQVSGLFTCSRQFTHGVTMHSQSEARKYRFSSEMELSLPMVKFHDV
ncbi:unnamed protein product [Closterium sp. Yama58-4]|nr:unnamed protein product [Closterium sp. Yama58-4]